MGRERVRVMMERESESDGRRESESESESDGRREGENDIFGREKIIWGEIWAVRSTQFDFSRR